MFNISYYIKINTYSIYISKNNKYEISKEIIY